MIITRYRGRGRGRRLFQFAFAAALSEEAGVPFAADEIKGFPGTAGHPFPLDYDPAVEVPEGSQEVISGRAVDVDVAALAETAKTKDVFIRGAKLQNSSYFENHREFLRARLVPESGQYREIADNEIVVNLTISNYFEGRQRRSYPAEGIYFLLESLDFDKIVIVTDDPYHRRVSALRANFPSEIYSGDFMENYRTMYNADRLIVTPSAESWWAAWTGHSSSLYLPNNLGIWRSKRSSLGFEGPGVSSWDRNGLYVPSPETDAKTVTDDGAGTDAKTVTDDDTGTDAKTGTDDGTGTGAKTGTDDGTGDGTGTS